MLSASHQNLNPVLDRLLQDKPAVLDFIEAAAIINFSKNAAYVARARGQFPVRVRQQAQHLVVFTSDLIEFLQTGESQAALSVKPLTKKFRRQTGRPTKAETVEASRRGLSVRELRAQSKIGGV